MTLGVRFHIIHVSDTHMIGQGTDGISRVNILEGIIYGR